MRFILEASGLACPLRSAVPEKVVRSADVLVEAMFWGLVEGHGRYLRVARVLWEVARVLINRAVEAFIVAGLVVAAALLRWTMKTYAFTQVQGYSQETVSREYIFICDEKRYFT